MKAIERRLAALEQRESVNARQMHVIKAIDRDDGMRQISELMSAGAVDQNDGFLCITGKPIVQ
ncbi:hypothetical protein [Nitrobacter sp. Nb-311A]|uniref:hypothetical protein n=1 Tax=Nitrobacter sp. Nb-311A TaxID=314253 RepID=UPI00103F0460|nr:hypothetical protein [Nitrobacter sp. Nb-311A]